MIRATFGELEASRVDERLGIRERVGFVATGPGCDRRFVCVHEPLTQPIGGALICSSILADFLSNYQREVQLARHLASHGIVSVRFHYRGTGNSDGDPATVTVDTLGDDARWAQKHLRDGLDGAPMALVGTRWGAVAAAVAAADEPGVPVVLCEPIVDADRFFREAMRSRSMSAIASRRPNGSARLRLDELLAVEGHADVLGHVIHPRFHGSAIGRDMLAAFGKGSRAALVVQFGGAELRSDLEGFVRGLTANSGSVDTARVDVAESWWFRSGPRVSRHPELNEQVSSWVLAQLQRAMEPA